MSNEGFKIREISKNGRRKRSNKKKMTQVEEGDECHHQDLWDQQFVLLLRVTQANGRPLPIGGFTSRAMIQMVCDITGMIPKEADILTDQDVVLEIEDQSSIVEVSRVIQGLFHWGGQAITVDSVVANPGLDNQDYKRMGGSEGQTKGIGARTMMTKIKSTRIPATND